MRLPVLLVAALFVGRGFAAIVASPDDDNVFAWNNPQIVCPAGQTCNSDTGFTHPAVLATGPVVTTSDFYIQAPDGTIVSVLYSILGMQAINEAIPQVAPAPAPARELGEFDLCTGTDVVNTTSGCVWRTNWARWLCHPTEPICYCPVQLVQDSASPRTVRHVAYYWYLDDYDYDAASSYSNAIIAAACVSPSDFDVGEPTPPDPAAQILQVDAPCPNDDTAATARMCRPGLRTALIGDARLSRPPYFPCLGGPSSIADTLRLQRQSYRVRLKIPKGLGAGGCSGDPNFVYLSLIEGDDDRRLAVTCSGVSASLFTLTPADNVDPHLGCIAVDMRDVNGALLSPNEATPVCFYDTGLGLCKPYLSDTRWRQTGIDFDGRAIIMLSDDTIYTAIVPVIELVSY